MPFVIPAPGRLIVDPDRHDVLPEAGRDVPPTDHWRRRLLDGDVIEAPEPAIDAPAAPDSAGDNS